jgi:hypothetical protein
MVFVFYCVVIIPVSAKFFSVSLGVFYSNVSIPTKIVFNYWLKPVMAIHSEHFFRAVTAKIVQSLFFSAKIRQNRYLASDTYEKCQALYLH